MPSDPPTTKSIQSPTNIQPKDRSMSQKLKATGFKDMPSFMNSYGLKIYNQEDVEEARSIMDAFTQRDQEDWEASQKK